jgi:hypothetical protein
MQLFLNAKSPDHSFRVDVVQGKPEGLKYFCQSEAVAFICKICCLQKT